MKANVALSLYKIWKNNSFFGKKNLPIKNFKNYRTK